MINAGIQDGDLAIIETQTHATLNDIVAAVVDGAITLKCLIKQNGSYILKVENPKYEDIIPREQLEIYSNTHWSCQKDKIINLYRTNKKS